MNFSQSRFITSKCFVHDENRHVGFLSRTTYDKQEKKWVQIDLGDMKAFDTIRLYGAVGRRYKAPYGGEIPPGDGFPKRFMIQSSNEEDMTDNTTIVDYSKQDTENPQLGFFECKFPKIIAQYLRITALLHAEFFFADGYCLKLSQIEVLNDDCNIAYKCNVTASDSVQDNNGGFGVEKLTDGQCSYLPGEHLRLRPALMFGKKIVVEKPIKNATVYATALGNYQLFLNGKRAEDSYLSPGYNNYNKRLYYQTYDVTNQLQMGTNIISALLGDGWYRLRYRLDKHEQFRQFAQGCFGDGIPRFLLQLVIEYTDNSQHIIGTDNSWKCYDDGPYRKTSLYDGVIYDCNKEVANLVDDSWDNAIESTPDWKLELTPQSTPLIKQRYYVKQKKIWQQNDSIIVDFGTSIGGVCKITLDGNAGDVVRVRHIAGVEKDGSLHTDN